MKPKPSVKSKSLSPLMKKPAPASNVALKNGCTCPPEENRQGKGVAHTHGRKQVEHFCIARNCPMHGFRL